MTDTDAPDYQPPADVERAAVDRPARDGSAAWERMNGGAGDDDAQRASARARCATEARNGRQPVLVFGQADVAWAFAGHEDDLSALDDIARQVAEQNRREHQARQRQAREDRMTELVLKEWDAQERADRRNRARAEAQRRLADRTP